MPSWYRIGFPDFPMKESTPIEREPEVSSAVMPTMKRTEKSITEQIAELLEVLPPGASIGLENGRPVIVPRSRVVIADAEPPPPAPSAKRADVELQRVIANLKAPKRQTKVRKMPSRRVYSLAKISSAQMIEELQKSVESGQQVMVYLIDHPRQTVAALAVALDMGKKTIENQITDLRKRGLLITDHSTR